MADIVQVALRGSRREFFLNSRNLWLKLRDKVIVQAEAGESLGTVFLKDPLLVELKRPGNVTREIIRKVEEEDLDQDDHNRVLEGTAFEYCRQRIDARDLKMDLAEVEVAFSGHRVTFYFSAEHRVDFRELVKDLAARFRCRIELRQIGVRDEAGRIGGVGTCGRELCCATWLRQFEPITLKMAKDQGLSPSPSKISGACGRLKCCLRYELDFYKEASREFPKIGSKLVLAGVEQEVSRVDIFRRTLLLTDESGNDTPLPLSEPPAGTKVVGPTRDRRRGCDKTRCGARGTKPGDGESVKGTKLQFPVSEN